MKKIINSVLFDSEKAQKIIEVEAGIGNRKLYKTVNNNFFTLENDAEIVPMSKQESIDFLRIHQAKIEPKKFQQILNVYFGFNDKIQNPLKNALKVAEAPGKNETLHCSQYGRQFFLETIEKVSILSPTDALEWIEENQTSITNLEKVLHNYFPTLKRA